MTLRLQHRLVLALVAVGLSACALSASTQSATDAGPSPPSDVLAPDLLPSGALPWNWSNATSCGMSLIDTPDGFAAAICLTPRSNNAASRVSFVHFSDQGVVLASGSWSYPLGAVIDRHALAQLASGYALTLVERVVGSRIPQTTLLRLNPDGVLNWKLPVAQGCTSLRLSQPFVMTSAVDNDTLVLCIDPIDSLSIIRDRINDVGSVTEHIRASFNPSIGSAGYSFVAAWPDNDSHLIAWSTLLPDSNTERFFVQQLTSTGLVGNPLNAGLANDSTAEETHSLRGSLQSGFSLLTIRYGHPAPLTLRSATSLTSIESTELIPAPLYARSNAPISREDARSFLSYDPTRSGALTLVRKLNSQWQTTECSIRYRYPSAVVQQLVTARHASGVRLVATAYQPNSPVPEQDPMVTLSLLPPNDCMQP